VVRKEMAGEVQDMLLGRPPTTTPIINRTIITPFLSSVNFHSTWLTLICSRSGWRPP
jgi:hypothetical protein